MPTFLRARQAKGFTLIEVLIVIAAALLVAVRVPERPRPESVWVGKMVFVKMIGATIDPSDEPRDLGPKDTTGLVTDTISYRVYAERANHVQVRTRQGVSGWVRKDQVVLLDAERANFLHLQAFPGAAPLEDAVAFYTKRLEANPKDQDALNRRAAAWRAKGDLDAALLDATEAIRLSPRSAALYNNRAIIYQGKKDYDKAIADFTQALSINPKYPIVFVNRAIMWHAKKDYDQAIADAARALEIEPKSPGAYRIRGVAWHGKKEYDKAIDDLTQMLQFDPKSALGHIDRANAWVRKKDYAKAHSDYSEGQRLDATGYAATLAFWLASSPEAKYRDGNRALELAKQAHERDRTNIKALEALAAANADLGRFDEAVRWQERAVHDQSLKNDAAAQRRLELYRDKQAYRQD